MKLLKHSPILLTVLSLNITPALHAAIYFLNPASSTYVANATETLVADPNYNAGTGLGPLLGRYEGITFDFTSTVSGDLSVSSNSIIFKSASTIPAGTPITFTLNGNMPLRAALGQYDSVGTADSGYIRTAAAFRVAQSGATGSLVATLTGSVDASADNLETFFTGASAGDTGHSVANEFEYLNNGTNSNFSSASGNTATFGTISTPDATQHYNVDLVDPNYAQNGLEFQNINYVFTPTVDILSSTEFRFTLEGTNPTAQLALAPEPASSVLLGLGGLALVLRRKR